METTLTVTEAARNFSDVINRTYYRGESIVLTRGGKRVARIVPTVPKPITGSELATMWDDMAHLSKDNADDLAQELADANALIFVPDSPWES